MPEDAERVVVLPPLARMEGERQLGQASEPLLSTQDRSLGARFGAVVNHRLLQGRVDHRDPVAGAVSQQVTQGQRPARGHGVVERASGFGEDATVRELGQPLLQALVKPQSARRHQEQRATAVIGLVIDWIRTIASRPNGPPPPWRHLRRARPPHRRSPAAPLPQGLCRRQHDDAADPPERCSPQHSATTQPAASWCSEVKRFSRASLGHH